MQSTKSFQHEAHEAHGGTSITGSTTIRQHAEIAQHRVADEDVERPAHSPAFATLRRADPRADMRATGSRRLSFLRAVSRLGAAASGGGTDADHAHVSVSFVSFVLKAFRGQAAVRVVTAIRVGS
jgi:hypothetical protein